MKISKFTFWCLMALLAWLLISNFQMYKKSRQLIKTVKQLSAVVENQGGQLKKLVR